MHTEDNKWIDIEIEKSFSAYIVTDADDVSVGMLKLVPIKKLKSFIENLLSQNNTAWREKIEGMKKQNFDTLIKIVETQPRTKESTTDIVAGYQQALHDLLKENT